MSKKKRFVKSDPKRKLELRRINNFQPFLLLFFAALLTISVYIRSLNGPLVLDDTTIYQRIKDIFEHLSLVFRVVGYLSFALNYKFTGMDPAWFRGTNIALHILTSMLIFYLTYLTLNMPSVKDRFGKSSLLVSSTVAVLFMLHPIQTSTVNYIVQRITIMSAMFSFLGFILYVKAALNAGKKSAIYYLLSALSFFLAIFSKENAVMVILIIPIYDLVFISAFKWVEFRKRFIPLLLLGLFISFIIIYRLNALYTIKELLSAYININKPLDVFRWGSTDINWTPIEYLLTELRIVSRYILIIIFPSPSFMVFDYSYAYPVSKSLFSPFSTFFSLLLLASLLFLSLRYIKKFPLASFGVLWYLITISLESFIALGLDPYFEHRNYLPVFGILLGLSSLLVYADKLFSDKLKAKSIFVISIFAIILSLLTFIRNGVWKDEGTLWKDVAAKVPNNSRALITLGSAFIKEGEFQEAERYLLNALKIQQPLTPHSRFEILFNLASIYRETDRRQEAKAILNKLISEKPHRKKQKSNLYFFMGEMFREEGNITEAREYLEKAYSIEQDNPQLLLSLGIVDIMSGDLKSAEALLLKSLEIDKNNALCYMTLGGIYLKMRDADRAVENLEKALSLKETFAEGDSNAVLLYYNLGKAYIMKGDKEKARRNLETFLSLAASDVGFKDMVTKARREIEILK